MSYLVTVAIPAYKAKYLSEAISSVLNQTYHNLELIIVNDKSPEDIDNIINRFTDSRIRYYKNEVNLGGANPVLNWNKCLSYAKGSYFSLLCDDDMYEPTFIETMLSLKNEFPNVHVFRSRVKIIDHDGDLISMYPSSPRFESCYDYMWHKLNWLRRQTISEFLYDTDYIKIKGGYVSLPKAWGSDDISCFTFSKETGIVSSSNLLVSFRMSGINISTNDSNNIKEKIKANIEYHKYIKVFADDCQDLFLRKLIIKAGYDNFSKQVIWCLVLSNVVDFISAFFLFKLPIVFFAKAFVKRLFKML